MNEIQSKEFQVFQEVEKILRRNGLRYYAIGGTCIGAIRHNGFIPWDDDIDIAMPREDYELFRTELYKQLPEEYKKLDCDNSYSSNYIHTKIYDSNTTFVEDYMRNSCDRFTGVFVDIMPVDGLPDNRVKRFLLIKYVDFLYRANSVLRPYPIESTTKFDKVKDVIKSIPRMILERLVDYNFFSSKIRETMQTYVYDSSKYILFTWRGKSQVYRKQYLRCLFDEVVAVPFEEGSINVPQNYDQYLTQDFGDYMKLPPIEEQKSVHCLFLLDMHTPCRYFREKEYERCKSLLSKKQQVIFEEVYKKLDL